MVLYIIFILLLIVTVKTGIDSTSDKLYAGVARIAFVLFGVSTMIVGYRIYNTMK